MTKWLQFSATVREAEYLLRTQYHAYTNTRTGEGHISCDHYSVPEHIQQHIDFISPTTSMIKRNRDTKRQQKLINKRTDLAASSKPKPAADSAPKPAPNTVLAKTVDLNTDLSKCNATIEPQCIKALYNFPDGTKAAPGNELGIAEWTDTLSSSDLSLFLQNFTTIPKDTKPTVVTVDGGEHARSKDANITYDHTESNRKPFSLSECTLSQAGSIHKVRYCLMKESKFPKFERLSTKNVKFLKRRSLGRVSNL